jgi:hypothetical protein
MESYGEEAQPRACKPKRAHTAGQLETAPQPLAHGQEVIDPPGARSEIAIVEHSPRRSL